MGKQRSTTSCLMGVESLPHFEESPCLTPGDHLPSAQKKSLPLAVRASCLSPASPCHAASLPTWRCYHRDRSFPCNATHCLTGGKHSYIHETTPSSLRHRKKLRRPLDRVDIAVLQRTSPRLVRKRNEQTSSNKNSNDSSRMVSDTNSRTKE